MFVAPKGLVSGIRTFSIRENNHEVSLNEPIILLVMIISFFSFTNNQVYAQKEPILEAETGLCETYRYALINSLREPVDKAIVEIYKDDQNAPEGLTWATYDTEILK